MFIANGSSGTIGEYNATTGATINAALISGLGFPAGIAAWGSKLFVTENGSGTVGEYDALTGAAVNAALITGLVHPWGIAALGGNLFVVTQDGAVGEYTTSGTPVNAALITGLNVPSGYSPWGIAATPEPDGLILAALVFPGLSLAGSRRPSRRRRSR